MIKFNQDITLECINTFDEELDEVTDSEEITFKAGELVDADVFNDHGEVVSIQYGDGAVSYGVPKNSFEIIE